MPHRTNPRRAGHIAILVNSLEGGGLPRRTLSLATEFASAGRLVDVYVLEDKRESSATPPASMRIHDLRRDANALLRKSSAASRRDMYADLLARALMRDTPDLLFSAGAAVHPIAASAKSALPQLPLVLRASSHPLRPIPWRRLRQRLLEPIRRVARGRMYRAADFIIAVSGDVAAAVRQLAPAVPLIVLPSPVVTSEFIDQSDLGPPHHPWVQDEVPIAVAVGRLAVAKDFPTLIRAFALVRSRRPLRLVILGDGPERYRRELLTLARRLGVEADIALLGWTNDVGRWLGHASVLVSTSIWEGSPGAVIEALAAGCPIVATDCPGDTRQLLGAGRLGGLAPVGDVRKIAALIEEYLDRPPDRQALKAAATPYEEKAAAAAYLHALDAFIQSHRN